MCDRLSLQHAFLLHKWDQVVHDVLFGERMQYIVAGDDISVDDIRLLHSVIHLFCALIEAQRHIIDAKDSEIEYLEVHALYNLSYWYITLYACKDTGFIWYMQMWLEIREVEIREL